MKFPAGPSGPSRAEELRRWATQHQDDLAQLASRFQVDVYGFDKELQPADPGKLPADPQGASTDILAALGAPPREAAAAARWPDCSSPATAPTTPSSRRESRRRGRGVAAVQRAGLRPARGSAGSQGPGGGKGRGGRLRLRAHQVTRRRDRRGAGWLDRRSGGLRREGQVVAQRPSTSTGAGPATSEASSSPTAPEVRVHRQRAGLRRRADRPEKTSRSFVLKVIRDRVAPAGRGAPVLDVRSQAAAEEGSNVDLISFSSSTPGDDPTARRTSSR